MNDDSIPASLLRQWAYCPRIPFIREVLGIPGAQPRWVEQGMDYDALQFSLARNRRLHGLGLDRYRPLRRVALADENLGVHGIADLILMSDDDMYVGDYKLEASRATRGGRLQLGAYALLAQKRYGLPVKALLVISGKPIRTILTPFTHILAQEVLLAVAALKNALASGRLPASDAGPGKCGICEHFNVCSDRE